MPTPKFLAFGDVWVDCDICGFSFPLSYMVLNHKTKKYVDIKCDDSLSRSDFTEHFVLPVEDIQISPQPVPDQGAGGPGGPLGAGEGGAGTGESGEGAGG